MFIKLTRILSEKTVYINANVIESIGEISNGTLIITLGDIGRESDSWTVIGYEVVESPEEIIKMIEEMKK